MRMLPLVRVYNNGFDLKQQLGYRSRCCFPRKCKFAVTGAKEETKP